MIGDVNLLNNVLLPKIFHKPTFESIQLLTVITITNCFKVKNTYVVGILFEYVKSYNPTSR